MRHIRDLLLRVVDGRDNGTCDLFEQVGKTVLLRRGFAGAGAAFGFGGDVAIGIETTEGAVAFLKDAAAFFDEWFDVVDELFFVKLLTRGLISGVDVLKDRC